MTAKLYYFNGRGLGEQVRIMLCTAGIPFEEIILSERSQMTELLDSGSLLFGQLPLLEIDGLQLVQTKAISAYLAEKAKMAGRDIKERARINMLFEGGRDFMNLFLTIVLVYSEEQVKQQAKNKSIPRYFPVFDKVLQENGTGFLVGESVTVADVSLFEPLLIVEELFGDQEFKGFSSIKKFLEKMKSLDGIQLYLSKYRKRPNDEAYKKEVQEVLNTTFQIS